MIARVVDAALASKARPVSVVTGHQHEAIVAAVADRPVQVVYAHDYRQGLSASLRAGITGLPATTAAVLVCLGDMPLVTADTMNRLLNAYEPELGRLIAVPIYRGKRGNPVLWDRRFFGEMTTLQGDNGARALLVRHAEFVVEVTIGDETILRDFDTREAAAELGC